MSFKVGDRVKMLCMGYGCGTITAIGEAARPYAYRIRRDGDIPEPDYLGLGFSFGEFERVVEEPKTAEMLVKEYLDNQQQILRLKNQSSLLWDQLTLQGWIGKDGGTNYATFTKTTRVKLP